MPPGTLRAISMGWVETRSQSGPRLCSQCFWLSGEPCGARSRDPSGARPRRPQRPSGAFHPLPGIGARRASIAARQWSQGRGVMERIRRGFRLLKGSWDVIRSDKELLFLPVISFLTVAAATAVVGGLAWAGGLGTERETLKPLDYVYLGVFYFVAYFIGIFFNAAVVGAATIRFQGRDPTVRDGLRLAGLKAGNGRALCCVPSISPSSTGPPRSGGRRGRGCSSGSPGRGPAGG